MKKQNCKFCNSEQNNKICNTCKRAKGQLNKEDFKIWLRKIYFNFVISSEVRNSFIKNFKPIEQQQ